MYFSDINFFYEENKLRHNVKHDFGLFVVWQDARPFLDEIKSQISDNFEIVLESEVVWTDKEFHRNASRIYEEAIIDDYNENQWKSGHTSKIKGKEFYLFVVKDPEPDYSYNLSVSKKVEITNNNFRTLKYLFREIAYSSGKTRYAVHSTNNILEFFFQAPLILGVETFERIIKGEKYVINDFKRDLSGANGWNSWKDLFNMLNVSSNYLILRNFDRFPNENEDSDIDLLVDDYQKVASIIGMNQSRSKPYKGEVLVGNRYFSVDLRFVGDNYYDNRWESLMLKRRIFLNGFFVPRVDDYFFSLLFHCKVQKQFLSEKRIHKLLSLSKALGFEWFTKELLLDNYECGKILAGYYKANGYYYEKPIDPFVGNNKPVSKIIPNRSDILPTETTQQFIKRKLIHFLPKKSILYLRNIYHAIR